MSDESIRRVIERVDTEFGYVEVELLGIGMLHSCMGGVDGFAPAH